MFPAGCVQETATVAEPSAHQSHSQHTSSLPIPLRLAVLEFDNPTLDPTIEKLRVLVPDVLITNLGGRGQITVVERALINKIMTEQSFQVSGLVTEDQVVKIGALSGATGLIVGKVFSLDSTTARIDARLIGVQNGEVIATFTVSGGKQNVVRLATHLSLAILSRAGISLDASEELYLRLFAQAAGVSVANEKRDIPESREPYLQTERDNLFWKQFAKSGMNRTDDLADIALITSADLIWPSHRDGFDEWPTPESILSYFEEQFAARVRTSGLAGLRNVRTFDGIESQSTRLLLIPQVRSLEGGWDCPWYHFMGCRVWHPRFFAEVRGQLIALNYAHQTYWASAQTIGMGSASTPNGAVLDAYANLIWKWMDSLHTSRQLTEFRAISHTQKGRK